MLGAEQDPKDVTLPPARERDWLIQQTAKLLESSRHVAAYLRAPLLKPTPKYFPDRWGGGEASVRRLLLRLLRYAGHSKLDVIVVIHEEDLARRGEVIGKPPPMRGRDPMAWFVKREGERLHFACEEAILREPENLVPSLARAVAQAHRVVLSLPNADNQRLVDVTGIVLGFGLLTTDASQRFYARSDGGFRTSRAEFRLGALSVQDMSFLLALQFEARGVQRRERRRLLSGMQPNQSGFVRKAQAWLARGKQSQRERLGLPEPMHWPPPAKLEFLTGPLVDPRRSIAAEPALVSGSGVFADEGEDLNDEEYEADEGEEDDEEEETRRDVDRGIKGANRGKPVFRIERSGALRMAKVLGFPVLMGGGLLSRGNFGVDVPMEIVTPIAIGLAVVGLAVGSLFTDRRCSEVKCGAKLEVEDEVCPLCGGIVMEVIHHPRERLGAEEELVRARKVTAEGLVVGWKDEDDEEDEEDEDDEDDGGPDADDDSP